MNYTNKFVEWLNGTNTIAVSCARDFNQLNSLCKKIGLNLFYNCYYKKPTDLQNWKPNYYDFLYLAKKNNCVIRHDTVLIEYQVGRGISFGYSSYEESESWYGTKPWSMSEVIESIKENNNF